MLLKLMLSFLFKKGKLLEGWAALGTGGTDIREQLHHSID